MQQQKEKKKEFIETITSCICGKLRLTFCDYTGYNPDMLFEIVYEDIWKRDGYPNFMDLLAQRVKNDLGGCKIETFDDLKELICGIDNHDDYYKYWQNAKQAKEEKYKTSYEQLKTKLSNYNNKGKLFDKLDTGYYVELKELLNGVETNANILSEVNKLINEVCLFRYEPEYIKQLRKLWSHVLFYSKKQTNDKDRKRANKAGISSTEHPLKEDYQVICHGIIANLDQLIDIMELIAKNKIYLYLYDVCNFIMELILKDGEYECSKGNSISEMFKNVTSEQLNKIVNIEKDIYSSAHKYDPELGVLEERNHLSVCRLSMTEHILQNNGDINIIKQTINSILENNLSASYCCWRDIYKNFSVHKFQLTYKEITKLIKLLYSQECNLSGECLIESIKVILECCSKDMIDNNNKLNLNELFDLNKPNILFEKRNVFDRPRDYFGYWKTYEQFFKLINEHIDYIEFDEKFMNRIFNSQMFVSHNDIQSIYIPFIYQLRSVENESNLEFYEGVARYIVNILERKNMVNLKQWFLNNISNELQKEISSDKFEKAMINEIQSSEKIQKIKSKTNIIDQEKDKNEKEKKIETKSNNNNNDNENEDGVKESYTEKKAYMEKVNEGEEKIEINNKKGDIKQNNNNITKITEEKAVNKKLQENSDTINSKVIEDDKNEQNEVKEEQVNVEGDEEVQLENDNGEKNEQKTEMIVKEEQEINNNKNNDNINNISNKQKKKVQDSNATIDISKIVAGSNDFASFCSALEKEGVAFNQINFSKEPLGFLNCFRAFFSILFSRPKVNCDFWDLVYLKVSYEFVKSNGKSFYFEANKTQNEQNIDWFSSLINKAQKKIRINLDLDENGKDKIK